MSISFALNGLVGVVLAICGCMGGWSEGLPSEWAGLASFQAWDAKYSAISGAKRYLLIAVLRFSKLDRSSYGSRESVQLQESLVGAIVQQPPG